MTEKRKKGKKRNKRKVGGKGKKEAKRTYEQQVRLRAEVHVVGERLVHQLAHAPEHGKGTQNGPGERRGGTGIEIAPDKIK